MNLRWNVLSIVNNEVRDYPHDCTTTIHGAFSNWKLLDGIVELIEYEKCSQIERIDPLRENKNV